jgi:putative LysE/RhtB family amino acid efflux pump
MGTVGVGFAMGFVVAAQLGPMSLLLIRSTLRGSLATGLAVGAGIAVVDTLYAAAGAAGAAPVLTIASARTALGATGAVVLVVLGARTLWSALRVRMGAEADEEVASPRRALLTALAATASNPLTIASWAAVFTAASVAGAGSAGLLVAGVGLGSLTWVSALAAGVAVARRATGPRLARGIEVVAGAGLVAFGGVLAARTLRES